LMAYPRRAVDVRLPKSAHRFPPHQLSPTVAPSRMPPRVKCRPR
jgi:hypothetical protein